MKSRIIQSLLSYSLLLGILSWSSCGQNQKESDAIQVSEASEEEQSVFLTKEQFQTMKMEWGQLETRIFSEELSLQGMVRVPVEGMQDISAYFGGYVSGLTLIEGQAVNRGQVLFYLENPEFVRIQQDYLETKSQLAFLKAEYERQETLYAEQIAAQKSLLKAQADYESARAKVASLKQQLGMINIDTEKLTPETIRSKAPVTSPISGFVEEIFVVPGAFLPASGRALSLLSRSHMHVELIVFEKDAMKLRMGQKVRISSPDSRETSFEAEIYVIGQSVNQERQLMVHAHVLDPEIERSLVPGMYLEAKLQLDPQEGQMLPSTAVVEQGENNYILVLSEENDRGFELEAVEVELGTEQDGMLQVKPLSVIDQEKKILVKGAFSLL
ncbi:MAG: efflux RND transporter periplasmic adaptor subunit [Bacteroidota bacterium]